MTQYAFTGTVNLGSVGVAAVSGFVSGAIAASPLGLGWQIGAGAVIGGASYAADCYVNNKTIKSDEMTVAVLGGVASGFIGGAGANKDMTLTNTVKTSSKQIARMSRRNCKKYAAKCITSIKSWRNDRLSMAAWSGSIKFAAGVGISNTVTTNWTKVKNKILSIFKK